MKGGGSQQRGEAAGTVAKGVVCGMRKVVGQVSIPKASIA